jgi:uncharacterized protein (DUF2147 family)
MKKIVMPFLLVIAAVSSSAAGSDDILGTWNNQEKDAKIEIYKCDNKYCGKIVFLKEPNYPDGSADGTPGTPKLDHKNSEPARRSTPIIGLDVVRDFAYDKENLWMDGKVYDPKNGKTYSGKITLVSPKELRLRGYIGISLIGRTAVWTRE